MDSEEKIERALRREMERQGVSNAELARRLDVKPQSTHDVIKRRRGRIPQSLTDILDELDLELVVRPKGKDDRP